MENLVNDKNRIARIFSLFEGKLSEIGAPMPSVSIIAAEDSDPYRILASTIISLRTKDTVTLQASRRLFRSFPDLESLADGDEEMIALSSRYMFVFECMVIPLSFQYVNVDMMTALGEIRIALPLSLTRKISFLIATVTLPVFLPASSAFLAEGISDLLSGLIGTLIMRKNLPGILQRRAKGDLRI